MLTDDDKTLVARLRWSASGKVGAEQARLERNAADRIEAQAAEIEELKSWKAAEDAHHHKLRAEIETLKTMIFATGEAAAVNLRTAMERALEIERLREAGSKLAGYAEHDHTCIERNPDGIHLPQCTCEYTTAWKAWHAALGEAE